jgi:hypothetical protein
MRAKGKKPVMEIIEECDEINWHRREAYYIRKFQKQGCKLFNRYRGVKRRTDSIFRSEVHQILLEAKYYRLPDNPIEIRVGLRDNEYWGVDGNRINNIYRYRTNSQVSLAHYSVNINGQAYLIPKQSYLYKMQMRDLPILPAHFVPADKFL